MTNSTLKNVVARIVPPRLISELNFEAKMIALKITNNLLPHRKITLARIRALRELKVNIGCGPFKAEGWLNVDLDKSADLQTDIRYGLPFSDGSCRFIFSEHVFEHLDLEELRKLLADCYRVLEPGGAIRIIMPNLACLIRAYSENDREFVQAVMNEDITCTAFINRIFYHPTHRYIHDFESISSILKEAGFTKIYHSSYKNSLFPELNIDSDLPHRKLDSLYVEAVR